MFFSIQYNAYQTILPLLFQLNEKFPDNSKILSRLGKTLSNKLISKNEEGWVYLRKNIDLLKKDNKQEQYEGHIYYYLYNLLNNRKFNLVQVELNIYKEGIQDKPKYHRFLATFYEVLSKPEEEIISQHKTAFKISDTNDEKLKSINSYLDYLTRIDGLKYRLKIEELKKKRIELYITINESETKPSR